MARAVGIDLGTTNSVISVLEGGEPTVIVGVDGSRTTPSVVAFAPGGELLVGEVARRQAVTNPDRTICSVKREMGTHWSIDIDGRRYTPQEISARVLMKLKRDAEVYLNERPSDAVITVPAYFNDVQRQATKEAGEIAGFNVLRIVSEPVAAGLAYALDRSASEQTVLVFDLGGGTLSIAVLDLDMGVVEVRSTSGDNHLGGDDWDQRIVDHLVKTFRGEHGVDLSGHQAAMQRLREAARRAKLDLTSDVETSIRLPYLAPGPAAPLHLDIELSRAEFEQMTQDLVDRCKGPFEQAIKDAHLTAGDLDQVVLVGGATRMQAVSDLLRRLTGKEPNRSVNPDEVVAVGAGLQAGVLKGEVKDLLLMDVIPLSLGIETKGGIFTKLIERNTTIPTKRSEIFSTHEDNQTDYVVRVFQGERDIAVYNKMLGEFTLTDLPPAPRDVPQIEVTFDIDANGIVHVSAKDLGTGNERSMTITGGSALPQADIERMIHDAEEHAEEDELRREEAEVRNLAEALQWQTEKFLAETGDTLPAGARREVDRSLAALRVALGGSDIVRIRSTHDQLVTSAQRVTAAVYARSAEAMAAVFEAKVLLLGEGTVGKTSLVAALRGEPFGHHDQTHGIEVHTLSVRHPVHDAELTLRLWDFGGQAVYRMTHQFFYTPQALYLVVWNARAGQQANDVRGWLHGIRSRVGPDAKVMIVATHCDENDPDPDLDYATLLRQYKGMLCGHYAVDNATGTGLAELRAAIIQHAAAMQRDGSTFPRSWLAARDAVLARGYQEPQIPFHEFAAVCGRHGLTEGGTEILAAQMHDLGQIVYHDEDGLRDIVILDPEWLSKTIAKVVEDPQTRAARGVLDHARLGDIWRARPGEPAYHRRLYPYFLRLMEKFDLSYRLEDDRRSLIAQLVPAARPDLPWDEHTPLPSGTRQLRLNTRLAEPVEGVIAALTVRLNFATVGLHWRQGVFLRHPNPLYNSEATLDLQDGNHLRLEVRAPAPDLFFHMLLGGIDAYFTRRWPGLRVAHYIPCPTGAASDLACPGEFPLDGLLGRRDQPDSSVQCLSCFHRHDIADLLAGLSPHAGLRDAPSIEELSRRLDALQHALHDTVQRGVDRLERRMEVIGAENAENAHALRMLLSFVTTEISDCPPLFTLTRHQPQGLAKARIHQNQYRLTLWCEQPDQWHPWAPSTEVIEQTKEWVARIARYARPVYKVLRSAVPVAGALAGLVFDQRSLDTANHELGLVQTLLAEVADIATPEHPVPVGSPQKPRPAKGADLREVREFLVAQCGPWFGGLERVPAPTGEYLWVCPDHLSQYEPGLPLVG